MKPCLTGLRIFCLLVLLVPATVRLTAAGAVQHLLYVSVPGIRNEVGWGGIGILVYDMDHAHKLVKRIPTLPVVPGQAAEAVKGLCANGRTGRLYLTTTKRLLCLDLQTDKILWDRSYEGGCDRPSLTPDGATLYLPMLEGPAWHVVDAATGDLRATVTVNSGSHNTVCGLDGRAAYLAGLKSTLLSVVDTETQKVVKTIGPFSNVIRPFTVNGRQSLCYVNVNERLGFEIGDLKTGRVVAQVDVTGFAKGPVKRHGCPSHGIGLTPNEKELWLSDGFNNRVHLFDLTRMPPTEITSISLRDQPGWITFSLDGRYGYPSTGEVIDTRTRRIVTALADEAGKPVQSEKMVEVDWAGGKPLHAGDQFGLGRKR
jgi:DNA-binding beta-propeller fold protein YncE